MGGSKRPTTLNVLDNCVSENDHILSLTLLLINILYVIFVLDSFAWISLINVCMYNGSLPVGLGLISHVLLKTNLKYLKVSCMRNNSERPVDALAVKTVNHLRI